MDQVKSEFVKLSWRILEAKILYYYEVPELQGLTMPTDYEYDNMELEYLSFCKEHGYRNTLVHKSYPGFEDQGLGMMEVDWDKPSVGLALTKLYNKAGIEEQYRRSPCTWGNGSKKKRRKK